MKRYRQLCLYFIIAFLFLTIYLSCEFYLSGERLQENKKQIKRRETFRNESELTEGQKWNLLVRI